MKSFSIVFLLMLFSKTFVFGQVKHAYEVGKPQEKVMISTDKPVFIICNSGNYSNDNLLIEREKQELLSNFKQLNPSILIENTDVLIFKNLKKLEFRNNDETHQRVIFWDGKTESDPVIYEGLLNSSEFFASQLGIKAVSSYTQTYNRLKQEYLAPPEESITKDSKKISDFFVNKFLISIIYFQEKGSENFFPMDFKGIKTIKSVQSISVKDLPSMQVNLDESGLPLKIKYNEQEINFEYKDGLLRNLGGNNIYYQKDKLIIIDGDSRTIYTLSKDGFLLSKYEAFLDDNQEIFWKEISINDNQLLYKETDGLNDTTFSFASPKSVFPIKREVAHSLDKPSFIEKNNSVITENYFPDNKTFIVNLNPNGLIEKFTINDKDDKRKIEIKYLYEYYK